MGFKDNAAIIMGVAGFFAFFACMIIMAITAITDGEPDLKFIAIGFALLFIFPVIGVVLQFFIFKPRVEDKAMGISQGNRTMRYEGGPAVYCPMCHANLGSNPPAKCPECGTPITHS